jgi:8-oxo-dGTP diphosphatase
MTENEMVRAAGGVITRTNASGELEILVVHRPGHDDWSLPKGKREPGETDEACALREVQEETGLTCTLGRELPSVSYRDARGRPKTVRYWTMVPTGEARAQNEIDAVRWLTIADALEKLTYPRDRELIAAFTCAT